MTVGKFIIVLIAFISLIICDLYIAISNDESFGIFNVKTFIIYAAVSVFICFSLTLALSYYPNEEDLSSYVIYDDMQSIAFIIDE